MSALESSAPEPIAVVADEITQRFQDWLKNTPGHVDLGDATRVISRGVATAFPVSWQEWTLMAGEAEVRRALRSLLAQHRQNSMNQERYDRNIRSVLTAALDGEPGEARYAIPGNGWSRLGDMTRPDLLAVANHRHGLARANLAEAIYLRCLAAVLPDDTSRVEDVVSASELITLHEEAQQKARNL